MAESEEPRTETTETLQSSFPAGRVKRIVKLDTEINKINSDALFLISNATELFVKFLTEKSSEVAVEKKRKMIKPEHLRVAVERHRPTADFLLDSLPDFLPTVQISKEPERSLKIKEKSSNSSVLPAGARRIDSFFRKGT
ncbi:hypothetical protein SSX86_008448 [Deinandra increscens subsp. villosa]|uniref:Transcription factor CBF/NF-Y/archaeal histone domain-containing protein n=1 Tax=Deinandra increscens subsp. villosa TaxID=3103831 RepID=A0AAP0H4J3_9ASTR